MKPDDNKEYNYLVQLICPNCNSNDEIFVTVVQDLPTLKKQYRYSCSHCNHVWYEDIKTIHFIRGGIKTWLGMVL